MRRNSIDVSIIIFFAVVLGAITGFFGSYYYTKRHAHAELVREAERAHATVAQIPILNLIMMPATTVVAVTTSTPPVTEPKLADAFNLDVAFFPQAPKKNWDADPEEFCEEAALLGVHGFLAHKTYTSDQMEMELSNMRDWEITTFGHFESTRIELVARIAREYLHYKKVRIIENPTREMIRAELAAGHPVIVPADGKALKNPYFKNGGPTFHMIVVRGFTADGDFIANDPGTQFGENFVYKKEVLMSAMHDWDHDTDVSRVATGNARVLVVE